MKLFITILFVMFGFVACVHASMLGVIINSGPTVGASALLFDVASDSNSTGNLSWSHSCAGTNRLLFVIAKTTNDTGAPTATYNSVGMTQAWTNTQGVYRSTGFYLVAPATGSNTVAITTDGNNNAGGAVSFTGAHQTVPIGIPNTNAGAFSDAPTVDISAATGDIVIDGLTMGTSSLTVGSGQTERINNVQFGTTLGSSIEAGATTVTMSWSAGASQSWTIGGVAIKPL